MSNPRVIVIIILILLIVLLGIAGFNNWCPSLENYRENLITEIVGILVTILFVDYLFSKHTEKLKRKTILEQISRTNKVFSTYLKTFRRYAYFTVTPLAIRKYSEEIIFDKNFKFKDMYDLFGPSGMTTDDFEEPVVLKCLRIVKNIKTCAETILNNIDLESFPELANILIQFVEFISKTDFYDGIKRDTLTIYVHNSDPVRNSIVKAIKEFEGEPKVIGSNVLDKYIGLYYTLKGLAVLIPTYEFEINKVLSSR